MMTRLSDLILREFRQIFLPVMAICKFGHFKLVSKISRKVFELLA